MDARQRARSFVLASPGRMPACRPAPARVGPPIDRPRWLRGVAVTEYYPVPERWFSGRRVKVPGLRSRHRVDWLYSARGVAMQGEGIALNGRHYGIERVGEGTWVNRRGKPTVPGRCAGRWSDGWPVWFAGGWRNREGQVTFPLGATEGWANGVRRGKRLPVDATFAPRPRPKARPYRTVAVDPNLIPRGSRIYIPAYRRINGGWFVAEDTGGAIVGRHIDVFRRPPRTPADRGGVLRGQRVKVVPPS
jgi:3D (Asp-Asp-Asp) domain-containing protein